MVQGNKGHTNQTVSYCRITISFKFNDPASNITGKITRPKETSYEIICAADLRDPKNAYLELLAHPAIIIPYTFRPEIAKRKRTPYEISALVDNVIVFIKFSQKFNCPLHEEILDVNGNCIFSVTPAGITLHEIRLKTSTKTGATKKILLFALVGINSSLKINFAPSANGCRRPQKPTTLGPLRRWIAAITFRSAIVK
jgi:hypothetical protein